MMWRHYVYIHKRKDDGVVFYVGKGSISKRQKSPTYSRAHSRYLRSQWWQNTVAKHGLVVEIVAMFKTDELSQQFEKYLIAKYGRIQTGSGTLVNLTDGGDGRTGGIMTEAERKKRSELASRPRSQAWIDSIRLARKNGGNGGVVKLGDKLPDSWRESLSRSKLGAKNPMFGKCGAENPLSRPVVDISNGSTFHSITEAARHLGMRMQTLHNMLTGFRKNWTNMRLA